MTTICRVTWHFPDLTGTGPLRVPLSIHHTTTYTTHTPWNITLNYALLGLHSSGKLDEPLRFIADNQIRGCFQCRKLPVERIKLGQD